MTPRTSAPNSPRKVPASIYTGTGILPLLLLAALLLTSCQQERGSGIPLPTLIPTAGAAVPPATPEPTIAPRPTVAAAPTPRGTEVPALVPPTLAAGAPFAFYVPIEPANVIAVQGVAHASLNGAVKLVWSILGNSLAVETQSGVSLLDASTLSTVGITTPAPPSKVLDFSADGNTIAIGGSQNQVELASLRSGKLLRTLRPGVQFTEGIFSPDGQIFAVAPMSEIAASLWDTFTGQQIKKLTGFKTAAPVYGFTFGSYGRTLIWRARATVQLQDVSTGRLSPVFSHDNFVSATALTPDGRILATAVASRSGNQVIGTIKLWDAASGKELATLIQNNGLARQVDFSPDGRLLAAGSGPTIELWDVTRRQMITTLLGHTDVVSLVAFSPDGTAIASAADDETVRLWRLPPSD